MVVLLSSFLGVRTFLHRKKRFFPNISLKNVKCVPLIYWTFFFWHLLFPFTQTEVKNIKEKQTNKQITNKTTRTRATTTEKKSETPDQMEEQ